MDLKKRRLATRLFLSILFFLLLRWLFFCIILATAGKTEKEAFMTHSNLFYKRQDTADIYTNAYALDLLESIMDEHGTLHIDSLYELFRNEYPGIRINYNAYIELVEANLSVDSQLVEPCQVGKDKQKQQEDLRKSIDELSSQGLRELYKTFFAGLEEDSYQDNVVRLNAIFVKRDLFTTQRAVRKCMEALASKDEWLKEVSGALSCIAAENEEIPCNVFIQNKTILRLLNNQGLLTAGDLKKMDAEKMVVCISFDYARSFKSLESLGSPLPKAMEKRINEFIDKKLSSRAKEILEKRLFARDDRLTLEYFAERLGLTRERVRQIERDTMKELSHYQKQVEDDLQGVLGYCFYRKGERIMHKSEVVELLGNETAAQVAILLSCMDMPCSYHRELEVFYDSSVISPQKYIGGLIQKYGNFLPMAQFETITGLERIILEERYSVDIRRNLYRLKGVNYRDLVAEIINDQFPEGYSPYSEKDYAKFAEAYAQRFGGDSDIPSITAIRGFMVYQVFCQVDRGLYKLRESCVRLSGDLVAKIVDFIHQHLPIVYYASVYEAFHDELEALGVGNYFYLKGLIDPELPKEFTTKRNYIVAKDAQISGVEARKEYMRQFDGIFTFDDLRARFPGVHDYVFSCDAYEESDNGLIMLSTQKFIYLDKMAMPEGIEDKLKGVLEEVLSESDRRLATSRAVYERLTQRHPELLEEMNHIDDQFALFSLMRSLLKDSYSFSRPYISSRDNANLTTVGVIGDYMRQRDITTYQEIHEFCQGRNISFTMGFLVILDVFADEFVQISVNSMASKEYLNLSEEQLNDIGAALEMMFSITDALDTEVFKGYGMLPNIGVEWTKYLLAGVVRSYFASKYVIENTQILYGTTEFIIRRIEEGA